MGWVLLVLVTQKCMYHGHELAGQALARPAGVPV